MSKIGMLGVVVAISGFAVIEASEPPAEALQIAMAEEVAGLSPAAFESWCGDKAAPDDVRLQATHDGASCAWLDRRTGRVWHASFRSHQADVGLVDGSSEAAQRYIHNEYGLSEGTSLEGFPVWRVDLGDSETLLALAEYEDITLVQIKRPVQGTAVSMR